MPRRLLLVDDDPPTRLLCRRFLQELAGDALLVEEAPDGETAIACLHKDTYDAVLSDYRMGLVSGIDVLACALDRQPGARRVLMSGFADPTIVGAAESRARIHAFFEKPMLPGEFEEALRAHVLGPLQVV